MPLVPLKLPAGFYRNGTDFDASNRWRDGSLVRWRDGSLRPIGGWQERKTGFSTNPIRGAHAWESNSNTSYFAGGSYNELKVMTAANTVTDITPSGLATGLENAEQNLGYGGGFYGYGFYGTTRPSTGTYSEASSWSLDNFGQNLVACRYGDGKLYEWQLNTANNAAIISNAPTDCLGLVVTEERFLFALGAGGDPRLVKWCDKENLTQWSAAATNEAGDLQLQTSGQIMQGLKTRGQTLIITDLDCHAARYIGLPYVYSITRVGTSCGAVSRMSAVDTDLGAFWMGQGGFYHFDGNSVKELKCDVYDYVFDDLNKNQQSKIWAFSNTEHSEIWWFYPSNNSTEIDRYVAYDLLEGHWLIGNLSRTGGVPRGVFRNPLLAGENTETITYMVSVANDSGNKYYISGYSGSAPTLTLKSGSTYVFNQSDGTNSGHPLRFSTTSDGTHGGGSEYTTGVTVSGDTVTIQVTSSTPATLYYYCANHSGMGGTANIVTPVTVFDHETGLNYDGGSVFCETGSISIGNGDQIAKVTKVIPDELTQGDVDLTFKTRFHPNDTERTYGSFNPSNPTSVRFSGRQIRMRVTGDRLAAWRVGTMRLDIKPGGGR